MRHCSRLTRDVGVRSKSMRKTTAAIVILVIALVVTNSWWAYAVIDSGVTLTYREDSLRM
jgi:hypothetical protein